MNVVRISRGDLELVLKRYEETGSHEFFSPLQLLLSLQRDVKKVLNPYIDDMKTYAERIAELLTVETEKTNAGSDVKLKSALGDFKKEENLGEILSQELETISSRLKLPGLTVPERKQLEDSREIKIIESQLVIHRMGKIEQTLRDASGQLGKLIDTVEDILVRIEQARDKCKRTNRKIQKSIWLCKANQALPVLLALVTTLIADRAVIALEQFAHPWLPKDSHDPALLLIFTIQVMFLVPWLEERQNRIALRAFTWTLSVLRSLVADSEMIENDLAAAGSKCMAILAQSSENPGA